MTQFTLNGKPARVNAPADKPLLWALREDLQLTGTKFGCGIAQCGACTVHVNGVPTRSCSTPVSAVGGKQVTTIEGIGATREGKALQDAWVAEQAPQCGYCQSGQIMTAVSVLKKARGPLTRQQVLTQMNGNVCRCGTYNQIAAAVARAQKSLA